MRWRRHAARFGLFALLVLFDTLLGQHAVQVNAAGALLSPGGAMPADALLTALGFLTARAGWIVFLTMGAALLAGDAARRVMRSEALRGQGKR
ncbi:MAG: hypothetical protein AB8I08_18970 [Sandaracinaceae bacterium]